MAGSRGLFGDNYLNASLVVVNIGRVTNVVVIIPVRWGVVSAVNNPSVAQCYNINHPVIPHSPLCYLPQNYIN